MGTTLRALLLPLTGKNGCNILTMLWSLWMYRQRNGNVLYLYTWLDRKFTISLTHAFTAEQKGSEDDFDTAVKSLTTYFEPKKNTEYEIYKFRQASQRHDEKLDSYHTRLRHHAPTCEFTDMDREIKTQIVQTCTSQQFRRKAHRTEMTLQ